MPQPELDPNFTPREQNEAFEQTRRGRRRLVGDHAVTAFTLLPEIETSFQWEKDYLNSKIIGQPAAIDTIVAAIDRSAIRQADDNRPYAKFAFLGPTGVGKTETAKALSEMLGGDEPNLLRIDCSGFSQGHEIASLIGSPPGYVGREQKPILSSDRVEIDGTVVLFDEIEKGSLQLTNLLLQVLDNGLLELNDGTVVSFRDTIVIMTSNLGAKEMERVAGGNRAGFGVDSQSPVDPGILNSAAQKGFKDFFSPEFVNRLDDLIVFNPLDEASLHQVLDVKLKAMNETYVNKHGVFISLSDATYDYLVGQALAQRSYGVRPLVRALEKEIATQFGRYIAQNKIKDGTHIHVYHRGELGELAQAEHKETLVFGARPDETWKKKVPEHIVNLEAVLHEIPNTANAIVNKWPND